MKTHTITTYTFDELSEDAQEKACNWWRENCIEWDWMDENLDSVKAYLALFNAEIKDYSLGLWGHSYIDSTLCQEGVRGIKPRDIPQDGCPLTGYCLDDDGLMAFHAYIKGNHSCGDVLNAAREGLDAMVGAIVQDMEYQESDEYIAEMLEANEYEFTETGEFYA